MHKERIISKNSGVDCSSLKFACRYNLRPHCTPAFTIDYTKFCYFCYDYSVQTTACRKIMKTVYKDVENSNLVTTSQFQCNISKQLNYVQKLLNKCDYISSSDSIRGSDYSAAITPQYLV